MQNCFSMKLIFSLLLGLHLWSAEVPQTSELETTKKQLAQEQARSAVLHAQLDLANAIAQSEAAFHLSDKQRAAQQAMQQLTQELACQGGRINPQTLDCFPKPVSK